MLIKINDPKAKKINGLLMKVHYLLGCLKGLSNEKGNAIPETIQSLFDVLEQQGEKQTTMI